MQADISDYELIRSLFVIADTAAYQEVLRMPIGEALTDAYKPRCCEFDQYNLWTGRCWESIKASEYPDVTMCEAHQKEYGEKHHWDVDEEG